MVLYITEQLESATKKCFICLSELGAQSLKMRTCTAEVCEYIFEENFCGSLITELKYFNHEAHFDLSIASKAVFSNRAG